MKYIVHTDGGARGNPGPAAIGVVICDEGKKIIQEFGKTIGETTNNVAEYTALIYALQEALILKAESIKVKTDSQLLARQLNKIYKVRNANIAGLYNQAVHLLSAFKEVSIDNIPREENQGADKLATQAIKKELRKTACR